MKAHNVGVHCMSLVSRARKNKTTLTAEELEALLPEAKKMLRKGSGFQALFEDPDWVYAWSLKYRDEPPSQETLPELIDDDVLDYDVMLKHSPTLKKELKAKEDAKKKRCRGGGKKGTDSEWSRDREDEKTAAHGESTAVEVEAAALDRLMQEKIAMVQVEAQVEVEVAGQDVAQDHEAQETIETVEAVDEVHITHALTLILSTCLSQSLSMKCSLCLTLTPDPKLKLESKPMYQPRCQPRGPELEAEG